MAHAKLDKKDVAQLLSRGEEGEEPDPAAEADRIQGLGFAACAPAWATCPPPCPPQPNRRGSGCLQCQVVS
jgi:hypothetical protein